VGKITGVGVGCQGTQILLFKVITLVSMLHEPVLESKVVHLRYFDVSSSLVRGWIVCISILFLIFYLLFLLPADSASFESSLMKVRRTNKHLFPPTWSILIYIQ
jgi:hypothetical protein